MSDDIDLDVLDMSFQERPPVQTPAERELNEQRVKAGERALVQLRADWRVRGTWTEYDRHGRQHLLVAAQHRRANCLRCLRYNADGRQWQQQAQDSLKHAVWCRID